MCNKNMLTITERTEQEIKLTTQAMMSLLLALPLPDSLLKYVSINKQLRGFQSCFGALSGP